MNQQLHDFLLSLNCRIVNPILEKFGSKNEIGYYCKSTSLPRVDKHLVAIRKYIRENKLPYHLVDDETTTDFFIYKN